MTYGDSNKLTINPALTLRNNLRIMLSILILVIGLAQPVMASPNDDDVQTAWRLLDYVAVDYRGAVADGQIKSAQELAEKD